MPRVFVHEPLDEMNFVNHWFVRKELNEMREDFHNEDLLSLLS
jgi:hypothetical protein